MLIAALIFNALIFTALLETLLQFMLKKENDL